VASGISEVVAAATLVKRVGFYLSEKYTHSIAVLKANIYSGY
jgi:hypothetical protein